MKLGTKVRLKRLNNRGVFELDRAISKNNIAENSFALGHETHNSIRVPCLFYFRFSFLYNTGFLESQFSFIKGSHTSTATS